MSVCSIVTANSNSGSACIEELFTRKDYESKVKVRGVFRSAEKAEPFAKKYPGLETCTGVDASKLETLGKAFAGAEKAFIVTVHDYNRGFAEDAKLTKNMILAAVEAGVKYIVLVASWTVKDCVRLSGLAARFKPCEDFLEEMGRERGLKWTVLRGGCFMENLEQGLSNIKSGSDTFVFAKANTPMVATVDIGRSGAACLAASDINEHHEKIYEMSGPEYLTGDDIAKAISKKLNREIKYAELPKAAFAKMPEAISQVFEYIGEFGKDAAPKTDDVVRLTGRTTTIDEFLANHL